MNCTISLSMWSNYPFFIFLCPKIVSVKKPPWTIQIVSVTFWLSPKNFLRFSKSKNFFLLHKNIFTLVFFDKNLITYFLTYSQNFSDSSRCLVFFTDTVWTLGPHRQAIGALVNLFSVFSVVSTFSSLKITDFSNSEICKTKEKLMFSAKKAFYQKKITARFQLDNWSAPTRLGNFSAWEISARTHHY